MIATIRDAKSSDALEGELPPPERVPSGSPRRGRSGLRLPHGGLHTYVAEGAATGARFYRYTDGFLHQKVVVIDHVAAAVGTANFDNRSFRLNFEITGVVADSTFTAAVAEMLEADFAGAEPMPPDALSRRPYWFRLAARLARLTAPIQ